MKEWRKFFEVFTELNIENDLSKWFDDVCVEKAVVNKKKKVITLYLHSSHLIEYKYVNRMEHSVWDASFSHTQLSVKFHMEYHLSEQYTPEYICREYKNDILMMLHNYSSVLYNLVRKSEWYFDGNILTMLMEDSFLARNRADEIKAWMEDLFMNLFHIFIKIGFDYTEAQKQALYEAARHKLKQEIIQAQGMEKMPEKLPEEMKPTSDSVDRTAKKSELKKVLAGHGNGKSVSRSSYAKNKKDPEIIYGRDCEGDLTSISAIIDGIGEVVIHGQIIALETREIKNEKTIITFVITDFTDSIAGKIFIKNIDLAEFMASFEKGKFFRIKGIASYDNYSREICLVSIHGIKPVSDFRSVRMDNSMEKRVELHLHTVMSDMDSVVDIKKLIRRAKSWGHDSIAITDHGVLQAFPIAFHCLEKNDPFKIIYGVEGYFVDDIKDIVFHAKGQTLMDSYVIFDIETTGFSAQHNKIIEIGAVKVENGVIQETYSVFVNPQEPIPYRIEELTGINDSMVADAPTIDVILPEFLQFCKGSALVAHNADFDIGFISHNCMVLGLEFHPTYIDTVALARMLLPKLSRYRLNNVAKELGVSLDNHHRAVDDATATAEIFVKFLGMLDKRGIQCIDQLNEQGAMNADTIKKLPYYHGIILIKNETGRINMNRLVSASHLDYFNRRPRMPKSLIAKYREGLILGSACEAGELYQAILNDRPKEEIASIVEFYDYLEIQPLGNNQFMIDDDKCWITSKEQLIEMNKKIIALGEEYNKPVVATCDVHFLDPEDEQYRRIMMAGKGFKDADNQPPLYFRTTEEMLEEFDYLSPEKAKEVVIDNTRLVASWIENISPVLPDKCPPVIEKSDETLTEICYNKAHEIYGPELPVQVKERLERELHSIISNGFAVMYIIAQKLVWDSNDHGYLVGSRGSVGSSFAATMAGITEVNPLSPHYICPNCYYTDFDSEEVLAYSGQSGCDMPDKNCPQCGTPLKKEGHDIPFETFLGFNGDKEPDIDLNFSGDYQACAHKYTEELFGEGHAFRAGTIGTLAEKTARGYVYNYFKERNIPKRNCELDRLAVGCTGPKRTTGQHPGGIIVVPHDREIYEFTAIQHPANDVNSDIITTHFEYHSIDHNLLKLDILGHDDPTMIRSLEDLTGLDAKTISLDDKDVMSLFHNTSALGIEPKDIGGTELGCLGIPEFGTDFVIGMLKDTNPQSFSDLVCISGLSHGTDVWLGNAQYYIENGDCTISTCISTRDDIMTYLIHMGMEKGLSFTIMESVRKGKGLKAEWEEEMRAHNVEEWYIESCKKIKYMFPKAHAAAYVMMAWRIAYFKVFYPLAYYTSYFGIRASAFNYELMCLGRDRLEYHMNEIKNRRKEEQTPKDQDTLKDMRIVQEMYARGIEFTPIDIYTANDKRFQIVDDKIMPALSAIDGLGERAATAIAEEAKKGVFLSKEDFRIRTRVSKTITDKMAELGLLGDIPETNQLTFEF